MGAQAHPGLAHTHSGSTAAVKQYDLWWAELPKPVGRRPVLVLTRSSACGYLSRVTVAEVTTTVRSIPVEVPLGAEEGMSTPCVANLDNIHAVDKRVLTAWIGSLRARRIADVKRALGYAFDWSELKSSRV